MSINSLAHTDSLELLAAFHAAAEQSKQEWEELQAKEAQEYLDLLDAFHAAAEASCKKD